MRGNRKISKTRQVSVRLTVVRKMGHDSLLVVICRDKVLWMTSLLPNKWHEEYMYKYWGYLHKGH